MNLMCTATRRTMIAAGPSGISGPMRGHVERCEECAAVLESVESGLAQLTVLDTAMYTAPDGFQTSVMASLGPALVEDVDRRSTKVVPIAAAVATAAVATAAAGTAVILRLRRVNAA